MPIGRRVSPQLWRRAHAQFNAAAPACGKEHREPLFCGHGSPPAPCPLEQCVLLGSLHRTSVAQTPGCRHSISHISRYTALPAQFQNASSTCILRRRICLSQSTRRYRWALPPSPGTQYQVCGGYASRFIMSLHVAKGRVSHMYESALSKTNYSLLPKQDRAFRHSGTSRCRRIRRRPTVVLVRGGVLFLRSCHTATSTRSHPLLL